MISFHPTLAPTAWLRHLTSPKISAEDTAAALFPQHTVVLTDSGKSALATIFESLHLRGATIVLPAYLCDSFFPVLKAYDITPVFLDIDPATYAPPITAYTDELLATADAVVLVSMYGKPISQTIAEKILASGTPVIEDFAMRSPILKDPLIGSARLYSLPKHLPVPDGGLAILPKKLVAPSQKPFRFSSGYVKNVCKLLPGVAPLIARARDRVERDQTAPEWHAIANASNLTAKILREYLPAAPQMVSAYCVPLQVTDQVVAIKRLRQIGVVAERIWHKPIVQNTAVSHHYQISDQAFPGTKKVASEIVCAPVWHIASKEAYLAYVKKLKETLAEILCEERVES